MFAVDTIKSILNSDLNDGDKIAKITEVIANFEHIEQVALEFALKEGRKPTIDDRLMAVKYIAQKKEIELEGINSESLVEEIQAGIRWLMQVIEKNRGWEILNDIKPVIFKKKPPEIIRPLRLILTSPWEIALTVSTFWDYYQFIEPDAEVAIFIRKGKDYLAKIQEILGTGGLGDSLWLSPKVNLGKPGTEGNTWETALAAIVWGFVLKPGNEYQDAIERGVNFIIRNWNPLDGGWGFKQGLPSDLKSTALAFMSLEILNNSGLLSFLPAREFHDYSISGLNWILINRNPEEGSWDNQYSSRDSAISASFYAIWALLIAKGVIETVNQADEEQERRSDIMREKQGEINLALGKALRWYETSSKYIEEGNKTGWGWVNGAKSSGVENTAAALTAIMDAHWKDKNSALIQKPLQWLRDKKDQENFWGITTSNVLKTMIRIVEPQARLMEKLRLLWK